MHPLPDLRRVSLPGSCQSRRRSAWRPSRPAVSERYAAAEFQGPQAHHECQRQIGEGSGGGTRWGTETFRGDIVVVSCGAANSAKLLLMSANDKHPNGLANGSDQVGRNYMYHNQHGSPGDFKGAEPDVLPEDPGNERFLLWDGRVRFSDGKYPDGRQVSGRDVQRREAP